jgi:hypothetical protein
MQFAGISCFGLLKNKDLYQSILEYRFQPPANRLQKSAQEQLANWLEQLRRL